MEDKLGDKSKDKPVFVYFAAGFLIAALLAEGPTLGKRAFFTPTMMNQLSWREGPWI